MHKYLSLTRVLLKNSIGMLSDGKSSRKLNAFLYVVLILCMIPLSFVLYMMYDASIQQLMQLHQEGAVLAMGFYISALITFLFSIFLIPSIFYFSKDSETLLAFPLPPQTILSAKFSVCLVYEYAFTFVVCLPLFLAYASNMDVAWSYVPFALVIFLTLPMYPLILSSIITMLLMRFVPFFKNRDRFNMIAGVLSIVLAFGFSFIMNSNSMSDDPSAMLMILIQGNNSLISLFSKIFPSIPFASNALIYGDILQIFVYLLITTAALAVLVLASKWLYFKGAIGFSETKSQRRVLSAKDYQKVRQHSKVRTYLIKELRLLLRTPAYALNCISMVLIIPIMLLVIYVSADIKTLLEELPDLSYYLDDMLPCAIISALAFGFLFSNINLISATAISREGSHLSFMKYIPMPLHQQLLAKVLSGILFSLISMLATVICLYFIFPILPTSWYLLGALFSIPTIILGNYIALFLDILRPKLVWEQEAAAVKQNVAGVLSVLAGFALTIAVFVISVLLPSDLLPMAAGIMTVVSILLDIVCYLCIAKFAQKRFNKL